MTKMLKSFNNDSQGIMIDLEDYQMKSIVRNSVLKI